jgi:hypothetical protein
MDETAEKLTDIKEAIWHANIYIKELVRLKHNRIYYAQVSAALVNEERKIETKLKNIRKKCSHNWVYGGHGHNDDWYKCTICGETEDR